MTTEWTKYTGSPEQIAEMKNAKNGFLIRIEDEESTILEFPFEIDDFAVESYLICNPHPLAGMIIRQAQTGQPVYYQNKKHPSIIGQCTVDYGKQDMHYPFMAPDECNYSFTPFQDGGKRLPDMQYTNNPLPVEY